MDDYNFEALTIAVRCARLLKKSGSAKHDTLEFPAYAWPGGYTLVYITREGDTLCANCVNDSNNAEDNFIGRGRIEGVDTYDEGPTIQCANCDADLESSYGDPDAEENDNEN